MVVGPLGFLISCHTSCTEHSRIFPPGPSTSTDYKESHFPLDGGPMKGQPNSRKPLWQYSPYTSQILMAKIILHLPIVLPGPKRADLPHTCLSLPPPPPRPVLPTSSIMQQCLKCFSPPTQWCQET